MLYRAIGVMSGSSLDGLDIVFAEILENGGKWNYEIKEAVCYPYNTEWTKKLQQATSLSALDYQLLHTEYGHYIGSQVNRFISEKALAYKVGLVASHGHTTFHVPAKRMTAQLGDGAAIAAATYLPVVSDLRSLDIAFGGQGAPIVPIGEKLLFNDYNYFLNIGGIANISQKADDIIAYDICPANRVLNMLANEAGYEYDNQGNIAVSGMLSSTLLEKLNALDYYQQPYPKSLANSFGTDVVYPIIKAAGLTNADALHTYTQHIAIQIAKNIIALNKNATQQTQKLMVTGGGAFNVFLIELLQEHLAPHHIEVVVPDAMLVQYKEALIMALMGVLRWREESNVLSSVTGATRDSVGGAFWMGQEE